MEIGDIYNFEEENTIVSEKEINGYERQTFHREDITFRLLHVDKENRKKYIIAEKPSMQKLTLCRTSTDTLIQ